MNWEVLGYSASMAVTLSFGIVAMKRGYTYLTHLLISVLSFTVFFYVLYAYVQVVLK